MSCCGRASRRGSPQIKPEEQKLFDGLGLLSSKPVLYVCNVEEAAAAEGNEFSKAVQGRAAEEGASAVIVSAKIESEIAVLAEDERKDYLEAVGLKEPGLNRVIRAGYGLLRLITFFTVGPKEARAWTIPQGTKAPQAAGVIHTDFEKGFIRSETISYADYVACNGEAGAREAGKFRLEGKDYSRRGRRRAAFPFRELSGCFKKLSGGGERCSAGQGRAIRRNSMKFFVPAWLIFSHGGVMSAASSLTRWSRRSSKRWCARRPARPSVGNSQPWRFVSVETPSARDAVLANFQACNAAALACYEGERAARYANLKLSGLREAPVHLAVFCDHATDAGAGLGRKTMPEMLDYSVVAAVHTLWLAARAEGLGVGWVSILDPEGGLPRPRCSASRGSLSPIFAWGGPQEEHLDPELERHDWQAHIRRK